MAAKMFKFVVGVVVLWFIVLCYLGPTLFSLMEESRKASTEFDRINKQIEQLQSANAKIKRDLSSSPVIQTRDSQESIKQERFNKLQRLNDAAKEKLSKKLLDAESKIEELQKELVVAQSAGGSKTGNSVNSETLRRRIGNQIKEMWFLVSASYSKLVKTLPETAKPGFQNMLEKFGEIQRITETNFEEFTTMDGQQGIRDKTAETLSEQIQKRLHKLQNPENCDTARKLVCSLTKGCGYGCQMHHVLYCFMAAYATKRTLVINSEGWRYSSKGWKAYFNTVSDTCVHWSNAKPWSRDHEQVKEVNFPIVDSLFPRPKQMPQNVPKEFYDRIQSFHGHPFVWWIGQFCKYLFNYSVPIQELIENKKKILGFGGPIVG